jgi:hypothetical protein
MPPRRKFAAPPRRPAPLKKIAPPVRKEYYPRSPDYRPVKPGRHR